MPVKTSVSTYQGSLRHVQRVTASDAAQKDFIGVSGVASRPLSRQLQRQQAITITVTTKAPASLTCALKTEGLGLAARACNKSNWRAIGHQSTLPLVTIQAVEFQPRLEYHQD